MQFYELISNIKEKYYKIKNNKIPYFFKLIYRMNQI